MICVGKVQRVFKKKNKNIIHSIFFPHRIARESNGNSIVLSVSSVDMLSSSSIQSLVANAPCDVVAVLEPTTPPVVVESPPAEANSDSNNNNASNAGKHTLQ